jgi:hypothetical protein
LGDDVCFANFFAIVQSCCPNPLTLKRKLFNLGVGSGWVLVGFLDFKSPKKLFSQVGRKRE